MLRFRDKWTITTRSPHCSTTAPTTTAPRRKAPPPPRKRRRAPSSTADRRRRSGRRRRRRRRRAIGGSRRRPPKNGVGVCVCVCACIFVLLSSSVFNNVERGHGESAPRRSRLHRSSEVDINCHVSFFFLSFSRVLSSVHTLLIFCLLQQQRRSLLEMVFWNYCCLTSTHPRFVPFWSNSSSACHLFLALLVGCRGRMCP